MEILKKLCTLQVWKLNSEHFLNVEKAHKKVIICKIRNIQARVLLYLKKLFTILIVTVTDIKKQLGSIHILRHSHKGSRGQ